MENFKFTLFSIIVLLILVFVGYWGFSSIQSGNSSVNSQKLVELTKQNKSLTEKSSTLSDQVSELQGEIDKLTKQTQALASSSNNSTSTVKTPTTYKYQSLINSLQKLIADNVTIKNGSKGTRVGVIQNFLNTYNNTSNRVDNDFGASSENAVKKFQRDTGLTADGEVGPGTLRKMISWLKTQS